MVSITPHRPYLYLSSSTSISTGLQPPGLLELVPDNGIMLLKILGTGNIGC
jgi:hypothetical protein